MLEVVVPIVVAVLSFAGTAIGSYQANKKNTALVAYRLEELEKKVDKHNQVVERTYRLEEQMKVANHRIADLEEKV